MAPASTQDCVFVIAARRSALGRPGGLHRARRLEALAGPVIEAALKDAALTPDAVQEMVLGNTTAGSNPARLVALAAGLGESVPALTVDRDAASGLDAILLAAQAIRLGEAEVAIAGGAESISTAPWRVARPKSVFQTPRFIGLEDSTPGEEASFAMAVSEELASRLAISRDRQDAYALRARLKAETARGAGRHVGEIVPLRMAGEEARDESDDFSEMEELAALSPFVLPGGTHTSGNTSGLHDGAAIAVLVSARRHAKLGSPPALRLVASVRQGVAAGEEARAPAAALAELLERTPNVTAAELGQVEMSETSAAQALALAAELGLDDAQLNADGGAIASGHPLGAAGAVSVVRLFTGLVRKPSQKRRARIGAVTQGAAGGLGVAALFEAV